MMDPNGIRSFDVPRTALALLGCATISICVGELLIRLVHLVFRRARQGRQTTDRQSARRTDR